MDEPLEVKYVLNLVSSLSSVYGQKDLSANASILLKLSEICKIKTGEKEKWDSIMNEIEEIIKELYEAMLHTVAESSLKRVGVEIFVRGHNEKGEIEKIGNRLRRLAEIETMIIQEISKLY